MLWIGCLVPFVHFFGLFGLFAFLVRFCRDTPSGSVSVSASPLRLPRFLNLTLSPYDFFFLHCRASARHGRSTTGICVGLKSNFPGSKKQKTHTNKTQTNTTTKTHTPASCQGNSQTKWDKVKQNAPLSAPHKFSSTMYCSTPPRRPMVRCQPYLHLHLDPQASLLRLASDVVAWVDKCPL